MRRPNPTLQPTGYSGLRLLPPAAELERSGLHCGGGGTRVRSGSEQTGAQNAKEKQNWEYAAGLVWPLLIKAAARREKLTYGNVASIIKTNPLSVGLALGPIQDFCLDGHLPR